MENADSLNKLYFVTSMDRGKTIILTNARKHALHALPSSQDIVTRKRESFPVRDVNKNCGPLSFESTCDDTGFRQKQSRRSTPARTRFTYDTAVGSEASQAARSCKQGGGNRRIGTPHPLISFLMFRGLRLRCSLRVALARFCARSAMTGVDTRARSVMYPMSPTKGAAYFRNDSAILLRPSRKSSGIFLVPWATELKGTTLHLDMYGWPAPRPRTTEPDVTSP